MQKKVIMLRNLNCPTCAAKIEKAAQKMPGMRSARVAFASGTFSVEFDEGILTQEEIHDLVRKFGVEVGASL